MNILYVNTQFSGGGAEKVARQLFLKTGEKEEINTYFLGGKGPAGDKSVEIVIKDRSLLQTLYLIFDYPYKYYTFKLFEV